MQRGWSSQPWITLVVNVTRAFIPCVVMERTVEDITPIVAKEIVTLTIFKVTKVRAQEVHAKEVRAKEVRAKEVRAKEMQLRMRASRSRFLWTLPSRS
jgi:RNA-binding protein YlmH